MAKKSTKDRGLGRGLSALLSDVAPAVAPAVGAEQLDTTAPLPTSGIQTAPTHRLVRNPDQPRLRFDRDRLDELAQSLRERGILQPILVRPVPPSQRTTEADYQIVAGERRYQAALLAKIDQVPIIIRELSDRDVLEIGVIENVQRANLNPMEEARAYGRLNSEFDRTHADIATAIGKSRVYVSNAIRLLKLPEAAQEHILAGKLTAGHARAILASDDPTTLTEAIISRGLSVREAERLARPKARTPKSAKPSDLVKLERDLEDSLGAKATLTEGRGGRVTLKLTFGDANQAEAAIRRLTG